MKQSTTDLFKGLLVFEGHVLRPQDLRTGGSSRRQDVAMPPRPAPAGRDAASPGWWRSLWLLGGRPMHAGHNLDLDEPFELPVAQATAAPCGAGTACC